MQLPKFFAVSFLLACLGFLAASTAYAADCTYLPSPSDAGRATGSADIASAWFGGATTRYGHGVLGDAVEAGVLYVQPRGSKRCALALTLEDSAVFEDLTPRIADITGDGLDEVITIVSTIDAGAALVAYGIRDNRLTRIAGTPPIGTPFRWLAPVGTADFNDDGILDVAYVRTPHLAGILKVWSFVGGKPVLIASEAGFSNHRIGENFITGGISHCQGKPGQDEPRIILPDRTWERTMEVRVANGQLVARTAASETSVQTISRLLRCE
jgi:hypothetical protein